VNEPARALDWLLEDPELKRAWDDDALPRALGDALIGMRRAAGLTQAELAEAAGWHPSYVSRLERGSGAIPSPETVARYAAGCGFVATYGFHEPDGSPVAEVPLSRLACEVRRPEGPAVVARREATVRRHRQAEQARQADDAAADDPAASSAETDAATGRPSGRRRASLARS
jgi:transcriptional regulator with XRE-family HTH domain